MNGDDQILNVWVLSDGRPGHYNQSLGIVEALKLLRPVKVEWFDIRMKTGFCRQLLKAFLNRSDKPLALFILQACYRLPNLPRQQPDLIISAGGKTSFLNAALARKFHCRNIFAGSLRGLSDLNFSAVLTIEPISRAQRNIVLDLAPTAINPEEVQKAGAIFRKEEGLVDERIWTMIVGGEGAGYRYDDADWKQLAEAMLALAEKYRIRWLITTSRRTGVAAETILEKNIPGDILADSVWYASKPRKVMQAYLGAGELVFCTEDSMSMMTEAIASGKPVVSLAPHNFSPETRYIEALDRNAGKGRIYRSNSLEIREIDLDKMRARLKPITSSVAALLAVKLSSCLDLKVGLP